MPAAKARAVRVMATGLLRPAAADYSLESFQGQARAALSVRKVME
jgi:hypothetical protein